VYSIGAAEDLVEHHGCLRIAWRGSADGTVAVARLTTAD
jgi:hypothetical protein